MKNKIIIAVILAVVAAGLVFIIFGDTKSYSEKQKEKELKIPAASNVQKITIKSDIEVEVERKSEIDYLIWNINDSSRTRIAESKTDTPADSDNYLTVKIDLKDGSTITLYYYEKDDVTYLEEPNKSIYTEGGAHDIFERFAKNDDEYINKFYEDELLDGYVRIDRLSNSYLSTALSEGIGVTINFNALYNEVKLDNFVEATKKDEKAFVRINKNSFGEPGENNAITYCDLKYEKSSGFTLITNNYSYDNKNNEMKTSKYKNIAKVEYNDEAYLILSNSKIDENKFNPNSTKNAFILKLETKIEDMKFAD